MMITSKYAGKCKSCGMTIQIGERIEWTRETGVRHITCPSSSSIQASHHHEGESCDTCGAPIHGRIYRDDEGLPACARCSGHTLYGRR